MKNKLLLLIFGLVLNAQIIFAQSWIARPNLPSTARTAVGSFAINSKGYYIGGETSSSVNLVDTWEYDTTSNTWSQKANYPGTGTQKGVAFSINGVGYYGLGTAGGQLYSYNSQNNAWTQKATCNLTGISFWSTTYFVVGTKVYFLDQNNKFFTYDSVANSWSLLSDFTGIKRVTGVGFSINNKGYICTGYNATSAGNTMLNDLWEYNPSNSTWTQKTALPAAGRYASFGFAFNNKGYVLGGERNSGIMLNEFWEYNPTTDSWSTLPNYLSGSKNYLSGFVINNSVYAGFGSPGFGVSFNEYGFYNQFCTPLSSSLTNGLVGYWPFCGNANDESGNGNNGIINGATLTTDRFGNPNRAFNFNGNNYIEIPSSSVFDTNNISVSMWVSSANIQRQMALIRLNYTNASNEQFGIVLNDLNQYGVAVAAKYNNPNCVASLGWQKNEKIQNILDNNYHHIVGTISGNSLKIYIDGILAQSQTTNFSQTSNCWGGDIQIGRNWSNFTDFFSGKIDDIGIWNRALTANEIQQLYTACPNPTPVPTGITAQTLCSGSTVANLSATGTDIKWYAAATGGTQLAATTALVNGTTYYASQTVSGCESTTRLAVTVSLTNPITAVSSSPILCINTQFSIITHTTTGATGIGVASGIPSGVSVTWAGNTITISGMFTISGVFNYSIPVIGGCGGSATGIIIVNPNNSVTVASSSPTLCIYSALTPITHTTTGATGIGVATGLPTGITASWAGNTITISGTPTVSGIFNYSIPFTGGCGTVNATGTIIVLPNSTAPTGSASQTLCSGSTVANLTATGTNIKWYAAATGGTQLAATTALVNGTTYYASQQTVNGCESTTRLAVTVSVNNPTVGATNTTICSGQTTTLSLSGVSNSSGTLTNLSGPYYFNGNTYYKSSNSVSWSQAVQNSSAIGGHLFIPNSLNEINFVIQDIYNNSAPGPGINIGITDAQNEGIWLDVLGNQLSYTNWEAGEPNNLGNEDYGIMYSNSKWNDIPDNQFYPYVVEFEGFNSSYLWSTGATTASIIVSPNTTTTYWCDVTTNGVTCRKNITISVIVTTPPTGSATQTLCPGSTVSNLTATGTDIKWYATATGGIQLAATTALVNGTIYYASQTVQGCESTTRLAVTASFLTVNAPTGTAIQYFCGQSTIASFVLNGSSIKWYATSTGGAELPLTTLISNGAFYYASNNSNNCESATRYAVRGYIKNTSLTASSTTICGGSPVTLTASDSFSSSPTFLWSTGDTTASLIVTPQVSTTYWVDIISFGGSCRKYISIIVNNPTVSASNTVLCQPGTVAITANSQAGLSTNSCSSTVLSTNLQTNLLAWYPFCGNVNDQTSNNHNGTVTGTTTYINDRNNNPSSAFFFDGATKIKIPHNNSLNAFPLSVSAWVKSSDLSPGHIIGKYENATWNGWGIAFDPKGSGFYLRGRNSALISGYDDYPEFSTPSMNDNSWHNLVFVVDQYSGRIYLDGVLQDTQLWRGTPGIANSSWPMNIGYYAHTYAGIGSDTGYFNGTIDDIGVWGRALTDVEVQQLYSLQRAATYLWSTGATTATINPNVTQTTQYWVDITLNGITCRKNITITVIPNTAPTGSTFQTFCSASTVASLTATGTDVKWYAAATGGTPLAATTALVNGTTYYASQTVQGCESTNRFRVVVSLNNPSISATATTICGGSSVSLTASDGNNSQQIDNKVASFDTDNNKMINLSYPSQAYPSINFSYDFWFNTSRTITLIPEKTGGGSLYGGRNNQNYAVLPGYQSLAPFLRGTGVSVGTNGIVILEHCPYFIDSRLTYAANLNGWHHCAVTYQNNAINLYIDGVFVTSRNNGTNFGGNGTIYNNAGLIQFIGFGYNGSYSGGASNDSYTGKLDEYRQWSVALTPSQITQIYNRKLQSISMAQCNLNLTFDQNTIDNNSITPSGLSLSNTTLPTFTSDNSFQIGGFTGTTINSITNTNFTGTSSSTYTWSTGQTSQTITVIPAQTTQYWVDVTTNGVTCRKFITVNVNTNIAPSINITTQSSCTIPSGSVQVNSPISGGITPQNLFISEITDATTGALVYIELFNKTGNTVNLSNYKIKVYNNGGITPSCVSILSGSIANNSTYVIKLSDSNNANGIIPNLTLLTCAGIDIDDNIRLTNLNDVEIDIWGRTDGIAFTPNNQTGYTYRRHSNAILPSTTWSPADWDEISQEDYSNVGTYVFPTNNLYNYSVDGGVYQTGTIFTGLSVGNHTVTVKDMNTGCTSSTTFTIQSASVVPTGNIAQTYCSGAAVSNLVANGTAIKWYLTPSGGTALYSRTLLLNNTSYFATQTINGCESETRLEVKVTIINVQITTPNTTVCPGTPTTLTASDLNNLGSANCLNVSAQIRNGLQAFYPFCGNANDISGNSLNGNVLGASLTSDRFGNLNSAYSFVQNQQISIPNTSGRNTYPLTISLWYNTATVSDGQGQNGRSIFTKYTPAAWNGFGIGLFDYSNEGQGIAAAPFYLRNTSNRVIGLYNESAFNQSNVRFNTWYHVVFTLDAYGGKMYLNGQLISTHNWTGTAGPSNAGDLWKIGGKWNYWFNGKIDDVAIWNRVLSPIEIQEIHNTPMTTSTSTYLWSTGETTPTINVNPTQTTEYSVAVTTNGVTCTKSITITVGGTTPSPLGANNQTMTQGATLANLVVTGQNILWYSIPFGGTPLPANTPLVSGVTYYASQTINGCESPFRLPVIVQITLGNDEFNSIKIVYSPNPVTDILTINASIELKSAKICNLLGQTILQQRFNSNEIQLNMSNMPSGTYFVIVEADNKKETFKILKK